MGDNFGNSGGMRGGGRSMKLAVGGAGGFRKVGRGGGVAIGRRDMNVAVGGEKNRHTCMYVQSIQQALKEEDGVLLSQLLNLQNCNIPSYEIVNMPENVMNGICTSYISKGDRFLGYKNLIVEFLKLAQMNSQKQIKWNEITKQGMKLLDIWMDIYLNPKVVPHSWLVPLLVTICNFLNKARYEADQQEEIADAIDDMAEGGDDETQNKFTKEVLNSIRGKLGRCRGDEERHGAYVVLLGESIKGCMQLRNMQMAAGFLKAIETQKINYGRVPRGPMVSFRFYLGKLYMQQESFDKSESELGWAFSNCPKKNLKMRRNILECLIAVRLRIGKLPPIQLLYNFNMTHYIEIVKAIKTGNIEKFNEAMEKYDKVLIKHGSILCIEKTKFIVYATIMRNVKYWWTYESGLCTKANIVPIAAFTAAVKWQSDELFDNDEMACISANLINMGYIKGYISWEHMVIVFSQTDAFPVLKNVRSY